MTHHSIPDELPAIIANLSTAKSNDADWDKQCRELNSQLNIILDSLNQYNKLLPSVFLNQLIVLLNPEKKPLANLTYDEFQLLYPQLKSALNNLKSSKLSFPNTLKKTKEYQRLLSKAYSKYLHTLKDNSKKVKSQMRKLQPKKPPKPPAPLTVSGLTVLVKLKPWSPSFIKKWQKNHPGQTREFIFPRKYYMTYQSNLSVKPLVYLHPRTIWLIQQAHPLGKIIEGGDYPGPYPKGSRQIPQPSVTKKGRKGKHSIVKLPIDLTWQTYHFQFCLYTETEAVQTALSFNIRDTEPTPTTLFNEPRYLYKWFDAPVTWEKTTLDEWQRKAKNDAF